MPLDEAADISDTAATALNGAYATTSLTTATDTFVFVGGRDDSGLSVFELGTDGSLTHTDTVFNTTGLELAGLFSMATATVGGTHYLIASGEASDGLSVFSVSDTGILLNVFNVSHSTEIPLNGARGLKVFSFGGETFLAVAATGLGGGGAAAPCSRLHPSTRRPWTRAINGGLSVANGAAPGAAASKLTASAAVRASSSSA